MTLCLKAVCETQFGESVAVVGSAFDGWDPSSALVLTTGEDTYPTWTADVPLPAAGLEFKLVITKAGGVAWEALEGNRTFPEGLRSGGTVELKFGDGEFDVIPPKAMPPVIAAELAKGPSPESQQAAPTVIDPELTKGPSPVSEQADSCCPVEPSAVVALESSVGTQVVVPTGGPLVFLGSFVDSMTKAPKDGRKAAVL
jgi:hypothetical protein